MRTKYLRDLLREKLSNPLNSLTEIERWVDVYQENLSFLYTLYDDKKNAKHFLTDYDKNITYSCDNSHWVVKSQSFSFTLDEASFLKAIQLIVDILTPLLPIGSVVDLKKEYLSANFDTDKIDKFRFIVQTRYSFLKEIQVYIPYGGVVYPVGNFGGERLFYFTPELIDKVVHYGFSDEQEEAFEIAMKQELIIEKDMCSIAFATAEQRDKLQMFIQRREAT